MLQGIIEAANIKHPYQNVPFKNNFVLSCILLYFSFRRIKPASFLLLFWLFSWKILIWFLLNVLINLNKFIIINITIIIRAENSRPACSHLILIYIIVSEKLYQLFVCVSNIWPRFLCSSRCESAKKRLEKLCTFITKSKIFSHIPDQTLQNRNLLSEGLIA